MPLRLTLALVAFIMSFNTFAQSRIATINNHNIELLQIETTKSKTTVVFENGSRETLDKWSKVIEDIKNEATVFAYNRPGYGKSDETEALRDGRTIVEELRKTLQHQGLKPPYLLVGHSLGGLYMQLFARMYPQDVAGVVLVDAVHPGIIKKTADFPLYTRIAKKIFFKTVINQEIDQIFNTSEEVLALPWINKIPMERLINVPKSAGAIAVDFGVSNSGPQLVAMAEGLYPNANTTIVDSDHQIQVANPEVVVAAIRRIMSAKAIKEPIVKTQLSGTGIAVH